MVRKAILQAPFPYFGGKSRAAEVVWRAFGDVPNYVEPFAGSLAVLLGRPHVGSYETVNDKDCYLANFWRAIQHAPADVAAHAEWPVNEADLHARHRWLVAQAAFRERILEDPDYFDTKIAGWWVWGISQWIGGAWCSIKDGEESPSPRRPRLHRSGGVFRQHLPSLGNAKGIHGSSKPACAEWFAFLSERLRRVRVCCGDWKRVLGKSTLGITDSGTVGGMSPCAVLLDPPYSAQERCSDIYATDADEIAAAVRDWAIAHGDDPRLRIALCGYEAEHEMPAHWKVHSWTAHGGYSRANQNRHRERIWFSPACLPFEQQDEPLLSWRSLQRSTA